MSLHDKLKFNKGLRKKITDKNRDFFNFKKWLDEEGAQFPNLYFKKYSDNERGVHTKKTIPPKTEIIYIPYKLLITNNLDNKYCTSLGKNITTLDNHRLLQLAMYILSTIDDKDNFYQPYYNILPEDISHLPLFWEEDTLNLLEGSDFLKDIKGRKKMLSNEYQEICALSDLFSNEISLEDWLWARSIVASRNFSISVNGDNQSALVPLADMLNHYRPAETHWGYDNSKQGFTMTTTKNIKPQAQVMDSYGRKSNRKFLLHYGFVMDNNIESDGNCEDDICIDINFPQMIDKKSKLLNDYSRNIYITKDNFIDKLLSLMRKMNLNQEELEEVIIDDKSSCSSMINKRNEVAALLSMANIARNRLIQFPKTYKQNIVELKKLKGFSKERNAINFVKKQKELLILIKNLSDQMIPYVISGEKPNNIRNEYEKYFTYF